uniref:DUF4228 domain-containing protein n=1 Tax=Leersia perrieri TaxID=77586 RepID=A0A0D9VT10_9ORYZ
MGNSLRCCLACVLPCGSFDVIRIVHLNGHIEEYARPVTAGEVIAAHPSHVLSRPCSQGVARRILIVSPESELKRGCFYFLVPASSVPEKKRRKSSSSTDRPRPQQQKKKASRPPPPPTAETVPAKAVSDADSYLAEVLSESKATGCNKRRRSVSVRATVWRPHLQIIAEEDSGHE